MEQIVCCSCGDLFERSVRVKINVTAQRPNASERVRRLCRWYRHVKSGDCLPA